MEPKKALLQIELTDDQKKEIKEFFAANGMTTKSGLLCCYNYIKNQVNNGKLVINAGGVAIK